MKIAVCIKQVPASNSPLRLDSTSGWIHESDATFDINEADSYALEEALTLVDQHGGEVVVLSLGPARVQSVIRDALAKGAQRGIHIVSEGACQFEPYQVATALANTLKEEQCDMVLTGIQSDDQGFGQTGVVLAELMGMPHASIVVETELQGEHLRVKRELEAGWYQWLQLPMPCAITIQSGINKPRYAGIKGKMAAKKKTIEEVEIASVLPASVLASQKVKTIQLTFKSKQTEMLEGDSADAIAEQLIKQLNLGTGSR